MKNSILLALLLASSGISMAQSAATTVSYNKTNQPGLMLELPYNTDVAEGFIVDNLKKTGYDAETKGKLFWKQNKMNGFYIFKEVVLEGAPQKVDLYFKVDGKGKGSNATSVIYLLVSKGGEQFIYSSDEAFYNAAKKFLNSFTSESAVYKLELDIKAQEEAISDAEKAMKKLQDNEKDMTKKKEQLEKDLKKNKEDQEKQTKTIEEEKKKLLELKNKKTT